MKLQFFGAAKTVTGSRTLLTHFGKRILIDCGLFQGPKELRLLNWETFIDPKSLDAIILTHAHIDHSGYLPKIVREGFSGPIYCSEGTADLCRILLLDSAHLQEEDAGFANRTHYSHHVPALPLYEAKDALKAIDLLRPLPRDKWHDLGEGISFQFIRAGHIIGASFVRISYESEQKNRLLTFSGDVGNNRSETLRGPDTLPETDYLVLESTYGDRIQPREDPTIQLGAIINKTMARGGILVIPSFSVGRTQEILYLVRKLEEAGKIQKFKVYVDSPLANHATEIYLNHPEDHKLVIRDGNLTSPLWSSHFEAVKSPDDSMLLCMKDGPFIVLSAAGMLTGGRIMHHLEHRLNDAKNTVLFVGYQAEGTKGRLLQGGIADLRIHHKLIPVEAEIATMDSLSAHADASDLIEMLAKLRWPPQKIIINHGEPQSASALAERIQRELGFSTVIPEQNQIIECP